MFFKSLIRSRHKWPRAGLLILASGFLTACSTVPREIDDAPEKSPSIAAVQDNPMAFAGDRVRWGGSIVETVNKDGETQIQLVSRPLQSNARPVQSDRTDGRFIAKISGFLDPEIYATDRVLTVVGIIDGLELKKIGDLEYLFPVVKVESHYLWQEIKEPDYPYYYYDPWYPWPYPYYRPYYRGYYSPFWDDYPPHRPYHRY
ncbi:MAG: Slp family lipoprotein [Gammaproteobacteria bacterium]|nr:Slp family lipoprotein [Gammaproteobacteria bacterium]